MHIELSPPPEGVAPEGRLEAGDVIPLDRGDMYPTTEQTLASLSFVLNGGGLGQLQEINQTLARAFSGREEQVRSLIERVEEFITGLNQQSADIIDAMGSVNSLAGQVAEQNTVVDNALKTIPEAISVLSGQRQQLTDALLGLGEFSRIANDVVNQSGDALVMNLRNLGPVLDSLANAGPALTRALSYLATYPWPKETLPKWMRGDYANLTGIVDLTLSRLDTSLFIGTPLEGRLTGLEAVLGRTVGIQPSPATKGNPLTFPYNTGGR
jgi:phospholipid/cholesterol/gamma-HCH transport system substrate-binding protein